MVRRWKFLLPLALLVPLVAMGLFGPSLPAGATHDDPCTHETQGGITQIFGTSGPETCDRTTGEDVMFAHQGADFFVGDQGPDEINGGAGNDHLKGNKGHDKDEDDRAGLEDLQTSDSDHMCGNRGDDTLDVADGDSNDFAKGNADLDTIYSDDASEFDLGGTCTF